MVFLILLSLVSYADLQNASTVIYRPENTYRSHSFIADQFADLSNKSFLNIRFVTTAGATPDGQTKYMWQFPSEVFRDPDVGHSQRPQSQVRHIIRTEKELLYDVVYTFDEYGRRSTPLLKTKAHKKFIALFGCSFTYGNAVNDNETLNYYIAENKTQFYPYNYGIGGTGINTALAVAEKTNFDQHIAENEGFVF